MSLENSTATVEDIKTGVLSSLYCGIFFVTAAAIIIVLVLGFELGWFKKVKSRFCKKHDGGGLSRRIEEPIYVASGRT